MPTMEQVISKPLSGLEVREIVVSKLRDKLAGDTRLAEYIAIPSFEFKLNLTMVLDGAVHGNIDYAIDGKKGTVSETSENLTGITTQVTGDRMTPNEARVDAGLGVPVISHDEKGRPVEKSVKYGKEQLRRATGATGKE